MGRPIAEAQLISALLISGDPDAAVSYGISAEHFRGYSQEYAWICDYTTRYHEAPSVSSFCDRYPDFPFRDHENIHYAADEVLREYARARLTENIREALNALGNGDVSKASDLLTDYRYTPASAKPQNLVTSLSFMDDYDRAADGLELPWKTLQHATGGIHLGNFWVFAARPGQGKSAFLTHTSIDALMQSKRVLMYSLEMNSDQLRARMHADLATRLGVSGLGALDILRRQVDLLAYKQFVSELPDRLSGVLHTHTPADGPVTPSVVASRASEYDLVVIDYLTLMSTDAGVPASDDWRTLAQITNRLKMVALASNTRLLSAAQINREGDTGVHPPRLRNLAQGDSIGQDADVVVTMRNRANVAAVLSVEKNRIGPSGYRWWTRFNVNNGIYDEIAADKAEDLVVEAEMSRE